MNLRAVNPINEKSCAMHSFSFFLCDSVGIRTQDPQLRRLLLYPTELPNPIEECKDSTFFYFFKDLAINSMMNTMEKPITIKSKAMASWADSPVRVSK